MHKHRYAELDALRGVAALYIVLFHYTQGQPECVWFFNMGVSAVDLFFLISGFVIFMSINTVSSGKEFAINRVSRLYPTYWACVTFSFISISLLKLTHFHINHAHPVSIIEYLGNLTMFQYYMHIHDIEVPYWTMIIEMLFYLMILVLFKFKLLKHITVIGCLFNISIIVNYLLVTKHIIPNYTQYFPLVNHFALFFAGIIFYKIITTGKNKTYRYAIILFCLITQIIIYKFAGSDPDHITHYQYTCLLIIYFFVFTLFVNRKLKFLILKPLVFLGKISFALYLIHSFFFRGLIGYFEKRLGMNFWVAMVGIGIPMAVLTALLITNYIEKPYGKKMKKYLLLHLIKEEKPIIPLEQ